MSSSTNATCPRTAKHGWQRGCRRLPAAISIEYCFIIWIHKIQEQVPHQVQIVPNVAYINWVIGTWRELRAWISIGSHSLTHMTVPMINCMAHWAQGCICRMPSVSVEQGHKINCIITPAPWQTNFHQIFLMMHGVPGICFEWKTRGLHRAKKKHRVFNVIIEACPSNPDWLLMMFVVIEHTSPEILTIMVPWFDHRSPIASLTCGSASQCLKNNGDNNTHFLYMALASQWLAPCMPTKDSRLATKWFDRPKSGCKPSRAHHFSISALTKSIKASLIGTNNLQLLRKRIRCLWEAFRGL